MSRTLKYKGYRGAVLYSAEDRLLHGRIIGIRDMILYDGIDIPTIETNFQGAVDEYLAFCAAIGKTPNVPLKGHIKVHVSHELHRRAALYAEEHSSNLSTVVSNAIEKYLANHAKAQTQQSRKRRPARL